MVWLHRGTYMYLIHRYWYGDLPTNPWIKTAVESINKQHLLDWDDSKLPENVVAWLDEHKDDVAPENISRHRANMVRLWLLNRYGGWWLDHDVIPLKPFSELPFPAIAAHKTSICTCVMGFPAEHPLIKLVLNNLKKNAKSTKASGEFLVNSFMRTKQAEDIAKLPLPFDPKGYWTGEKPWAIHLHNTSATRK